MWRERRMNIKRMLEQLVFHVTEDRRCPQMFRRIEKGLLRKRYKALAGGPKELVLLILFQLFSFS